MKRPQMRRRPKDQGKVRRAEKLLGQMHLRELKERVARNFRDALEKYAHKGIPLPTAMDAIEELVEDPLVRAILERREAR